MSRFRLGQKWSLLILVILVLATALVVTACGSKKAAAPAPAPEKKAEAPVVQPLKIGAVFALTGPAASLGIPERNTAIMLEKQINDAGGIKGQPVKLIVYDTETNETKGLLAAKKLVEEDKVPVVIGPSSSGVSNALVNYFNEQKVPMISAAAAASIVEPVDQRQWIFKTPQSDALVFKFIVDYLKKNNLTKVGFIAEASGYGDGGRAELEKAAPGAGIQVVASERFDRADKDMSAQLTKIRRANPNVIIVWSTPPAASVVQQNIYDMKLNLPVIQSHGIGNMQFIEVAGKAAEGVIFPAGRLLTADYLPDSNLQKPLLLKYKKDYQAQFNSIPSTFGGHAWDAFMMVIKAYEAGARTPAELRDQFEKIKNFVGISGVFNFSAQDHNGLDITALEWVEIKDGKWILHKSPK